MTTLTLFWGGGGEVIDMLLFLNFWWGYICLTGTLNVRGYMPIGSVGPGFLDRETWNNVSSNDSFNLKCFPTPTKK